MSLLIRLAKKFGKPGKRSRAGNVDTRSRNFEIPENPRSNFTRQFSGMARSAKDTAKRGAGYAWEASGASSVPALEGIKRSFLSVFERLSKKSDTEREEDRRREREEDSSEPQSSFSPKMEEDIAKIRDIMEDNERAKKPGLRDTLGSLLGGAGKRALGTVGGIAKGLGGVLGGVGASGAGKVLGSSKGLGRWVGSMGGRAAGLAGGLIGSGGVIASTVAQGAKTTLGASKAAAASIPSAREAIASVTSAGKSVAEKATNVAKSATGMGKSAIGKSGLKSLIKKVPGIGMLAGIGFGVHRAIAGDLTGAGLEIASGISGTLPGLGTAASLGIDASLAARDANKEVDDVPKTLEPKEKPGSPKPEKGPKPVQKAVLSREDSPDLIENNLKKMSQFLAAATDETQGVFVRQARDPFTSNSGWGDEPAPITRQSPKASGETAAPYDITGPRQSQPLQGARRSQEPVQSPSRPMAAGRQTDPNFRPDLDYRARRVQQGQRAIPAQEAREPGRVTPKRDASPESAFTPAQGTLASSAIGNLISRGEGDYDSYNAGTKGVASGRVVHSGKKNLSEMTLDEIIKSSESKTGYDKDRVFAAGRYQVITPTLKGAMKKMGLKGDEKFTPELQDRIFQEALMPQKARDYIQGKSDDLEGAQIALAKEWRSLADPRTGKTFADAGSKANKASISPKEVENALLQTRKQYASSGANGQSFALNQPENRMSDTVKAASIEAKDAKQAAAQPIVIAAGGEGAGRAPMPVSGGPAGIGGGMSTRNDETSIRQITNAKMGHSMS